MLQKTLIKQCLDAVLFVLNPARVQGMGSSGGQLQVLARALQERRNHLAGQCSSSAGRLSEEVRRQVGASAGEAAQTQRCSRVCF